jgi:hypothetical protein
MTNLLGNSFRGQVICVLGNCVGVTMMSVFDSGFGDGMIVVTFIFFQLVELTIVVGLSCLTPLSKIIFYFICLRTSMKIRHYNCDTIVK